MKRNPGFILKKSQQCLQQKLKDKLISIKQINDNKEYQMKERRSQQIFRVQKIQQEAYFQSEDSDEEKVLPLKLDKKQFNNGKFNHNQNSLKKKQQIKENPQQTYTKNYFNDFIFVQTSKQIKHNQNLITSKSSMKEKKSELMNGKTQSTLKNNQIQPNHNQISEKLNLLNPSQLPQQKALQEPYFQFTFIEQQPQNIPQTLKPQHKVTELEQQISQIRCQEDIKQIKFLFQKFQSLSLININQKDNNLWQLFQPYQLHQHVPPLIISSIPNLVKEFVLFKRVQNFMKSQQYQNKDTLLNPKELSRSSFLEKFQQVRNLFLKITHYQGIDNLFTADNKIEQIKRFFVFQRISLIIIVYFITIKRYQQHKNLLKNIVSFLIQNLVVLLNNFFSSKSLKYMTQSFYPHLIKKGFDFIKVNNDTINEIFHKISIVDQLFFRNLNKLVKLWAKSQLNLLMKQSLEFLAFYIHKNNNPLSGQKFSTAPYPFLKTNPASYYLVIDVTQFFRKDSNYKLVFRPFFYIFLQQMAQRYVIINYSYWTSSIQRQVLKDQTKINDITHKLYSHHFKVCPRFQKKLECIGVKAQRLIYITSNEQQENLNSIMIKGWKGQKKDRELVDILPILIAISHLKLNCAQVAKCLGKCDKDIHKMQESLLKFTK